jgi:hypothetical protein
MAGPWEEYAAPAAEAGPWNDYAEPAAAPKAKPEIKSPRLIEKLMGAADFTFGKRGEVAETMKTRAQAIPTGINTGAAYLAGMPMDALVGASNLASAGMGYMQSKITGKAPSQFFDPVDPSKVPLTGAFNKDVLNSTPMGNVTDLPANADPLSRIIHSTAAGIPGGLVGGGPLNPNVMSGAAGGAAGGLAGVLGADPATQATMSLLGGVAGGRLATQPQQTLPPRLPQNPYAATPPPAPDPRSLLNRAYEGQSMGAAAAAPDMDALSPELRQVVLSAINKKGVGSINKDALSRQARADSLPVKVPLTEGQATQDVALISREMNLRGKHKELAERFDAQNKALAANVQTIRDQVGPDVFTTNHVEHGDTIIEAYRAIDDVRNADIGTKYKALRDAAGGSFPIDTKALLANVRTALKRDLASSKAPSDVMDALQEHAATGKMDVEQFEALRSTLARVQRSASDGQERHAAGVIRRQIEELPLPAQSAQLKSLADAARNAARERFQAIEADPAYKAAVEDSVPPDRFIQKYVIAGTRDNVARMRETMQGNDRAQQTMTVAAADYLRDSAGLNGRYEGNFSQAGFNKALKALEAKMPNLFDPRTRETLANLDETARDTQFQPRGSFANNSNALVGALAEGGANVAEGAANYAASGLPVGTVGRRLLEGRATKKDVKNALSPGAGLVRRTNN